MLISLCTPLVGYGDGLSFADRMSISLTLLLTVTTAEAPASVADIGFIEYVVCLFGVALRHSGTPA